MNDILKPQDIKNNVGILIDDVDSDEELTQLIQCFPKEAKQFILKLKNSQYNNTKYQIKQDCTRKTHQVLANDNIEIPFSTTTTYRNTFCHQNDNNKNNNKESNSDTFGKNKSSNFLSYQPVLRFGEMPVFTDSILYPGQNRRLQSTTHETFVEKPIVFTEPAKPMPTNLRVEGEQDFLTTNKSVYTVKPITGYPVRRSKIPNISKPRVSKPFYGVTQFHADFPPERAWSSVDPACSIVSHPCQPPKTQIQLRDTNECCFHTEQRDQFQGHDAKANPKPKSCKLEPPVYAKPTIKLDCDSVTKLDFQPYSIEQVLSVNSKSAFGRRSVQNDSKCVEQSRTLKHEELELLKNYLRDLKAAKNQQLPKM
ncbi:hypothetical protein KSF78_0008806 [Schistosoma japonicum]|nr:hypothetical protein KSF78_0008806 [Schistosoma japonicum]